MESKKTVNELGAKEWRNKKGHLHREDYPARIWLNGYKEWWINGKRHRENGPAIVYPNGHKEWHINGLLHREDGPAVIYSSGIKEYWLYDKTYTEKEWKEEVRKIKLSKLKL